MPASTVHVGFGLLLAAGLLGKYYDRTALLVVVAALLLPEADALAGWVMAGAHRTLFHNYVFTAVLAAALWWDTRRETSWLRGRFGTYGVRVAWVAVFAHTFAHLALDWAHLDGINALWPLHDEFFRLEGELYVSSEAGLVQTFVDLEDVGFGGGASRAETHVATPADPTPDSDPGPVDRRVPIAVGGWQLYLVAVGLFVVVAKRFQSEPPRAGSRRERY